MTDFSEWLPLEVQHLTQVLFRFKFDGDIREESGHPALNKLLLEIRKFAETKMDICDEKMFLLGMFDQNISDFLLAEILKSTRFRFDHGHINAKSTLTEIMSSIYPLKLDSDQNEKVQKFVTNL